MLRRLFLLMLPCLISLSPAYAQDADFSNLKERDNYWALLGGYGFTHVGMGKTREYVETVDLVLRYGRVLKDRSVERWYGGHHDLLIEIPIGLVLVPDVAPIIGMNFLASWTLASRKRVTPYFFAGGGPVYTEADIPGLGSDLSGNYQAGIGAVFETRKGYKVNMEYRFHHISNAGTAEPNDSLNSSKLLVGMMFF